MFDVALFLFQSSLEKTCIYIN